MLIDTGFGLDDVRRPRQLGRLFGPLVRPGARRRARRPIPAPRALGFEPSDVRHIITTHLDLDHAGGLPDFPEPRSTCSAASSRPRWIPDGGSACATWPRTGRMGRTG